MQLAQGAGSCVGVHGRLCMHWLIMVTPRQRWQRLQPRSKQEALLQPSASPCVQGSAYWEVVAGYVGALSADIPLTSLGSDPVSLRVDEALITVRPRAAGTLSPEPSPTSSGGGSGGGGAPGEGGGGPPKGGGGGAGSPSAGDLEALGQAAVVDGVRLIAGGIEDVLQRLRIQVPIWFRGVRFSWVACWLRKA